MHTCHWVPVEVRGQLLAVLSFCRQYPGGGIPVVAQPQAPSPAGPLQRPYHVCVRFINVLAYSLLGLVWLYHTLFSWLFLPLTVRWCKHTYTCLTARLSLSQVCVDVDLLGHQSSQTVISKWITSVS